jgi:hypothetical protein
LRFWWSITSIPKTISEKIEDTLLCPIESDKTVLYLDFSPHKIAPEANIARISRNRRSIAGSSGLAQEMQVCGCLFAVHCAIAAVNAFNTPVFRAPNTQLGNSNFGVISSQANFARVMQLSVRLMW